MGLGTATLLLAAWVSTAGFLPALRGNQPSTDPGGGDRTQVPHPPTGPRHAPSHDDHSAPLPPFLSVVINILLVLFALLLIFVFVRAFTTRRRRRLAAQTPVDTGFDVDDDELEGRLTEDLARSAGMGLARLAEGDPRNAIVRCWLILEETVVEAGLARDPTLTSEEFTAQVLARYSVDAGSIDELGRLYREARFSAHELTEAHRTRAVGALNRLRDSLDSAVRARAEQAGEPAAPGPGSAP